MAEASRRGWRRSGGRWQCKRSAKTRASSAVALLSSADTLEVSSLSSSKRRTHADVHPLPDPLHVPPAKERLADARHPYQVLPIQRTEDLAQEQLIWENSERPKSSDARRPVLRPEEEVAEWLDLERIGRVRGPMALGGRGRGGREGSLGGREGCWGRERGHSRGFSCRRYRGLSCPKVLSRPVG